MSRTIVLTLVAAFFGLMVTGVFVLDWFVVEHNSIDLWAVSQCGGAACVSKPLESSELAPFHPFAVTTLWLIAVAVMPILVQTGAYLFGGVARRRLTMLGYAASIASMACVLITAYIGQPTMHGQPAVVLTAPLVVVTALALGMLAMHIATRRHARLPVAKLVS